MNAAGKRVVVLTGASSGIARATALALARRGDSVVLAARTEESLAEVAEECDRNGGQALAVPTDVRDEQAMENLARRAYERFGRIDVWVNAAAVIVFGEFEYMPAETYRQVIDTNLFGQIHGARAVLPYFRDQGRGLLVNVGSVWSSVSSPYVSAYVVSKFGVRAFSESLQEALWLEKATRDIRVCTILPQSVDTPIFQHGANYTGWQAKPVPMLADPDRVVRAIIRSIDHPRRQRRTVGGWGKLLEVGHAVAPGVFNRVVPLVMNRVALGRHQVEHSAGNVYEPVPELNGIDGHWRNPPLRAAVATTVAAAAAAGALAAVRTARGR